MKTIRLTTCAHVVHFWDFITKSIEKIAIKSNEPYDEALVRKTLINIVGDHKHAWIGVVTDDDNNPIGFGVAQECTPDFDTRRFFMVRWFYHTPGRFDATMLLMLFFETWAKSNGVCYYAISTKRSNGETIRCFSSHKYGFKKATLVFEKQI